MIQHFCYSEDLCLKSARHGHEVYSATLWAVKKKKPKQERSYMVMKYSPV